MRKNRLALLLFGLLSSFPASAELEGLSEQAKDVIDSLQNKNRLVVLENSTETRLGTELNQTIILVASNSPLVLPGKLPQFFVKGIRSQDALIKAYAIKGGIAFFLNVFGIPYLVADAYLRREYDLEDVDNETKAFFFPAARISNASIADSALENFKTELNTAQSAKFEKEIVVVVRKNEFTGFKNRLETVGFR